MLKLCHEATGDLNWELQMFIYQTLIPRRGIDQEADKRNRRKKSERWLISVHGSA